MWKFFKVLQQESAVQHTNSAQFTAGRKPTRQRRVYRDVYTSLKTIVTDYANRLTIDYLRAILYNLAEFL